MTPSDLKEWLWSAKVLTTILWVLFPLGYLTIIQFLEISFPPTHLAELTNIFSPLSLLIPYEIVKALHLGRIAGIVIPPIPFIAALLLFSVLPAIYPTKKFFKKRGNENVVIEYRYIRKILIGFLIATGVLIITLYFLISFIENVENVEEEFPLIASLTQHIYNKMVFVLLTVTILILLKLLLEHARKQFRFYYARACFEIMGETKSEADKVEYLLLGLDWYNKFVKRETKNGIDVETIYSKIISLSQLSNNVLLDIIVDSFHNGDELKPMRQMLALLSSWKEGATLVKESLRTKIRESSDLLIPIVSVVITVIATFFVKPI